MVATICSQRQGHNLHDFRDQRKFFSQRSWILSIIRLTSKAENVGILEMGKSHSTQKKVNQIEKKQEKCYSIIVHRWETSECGLKKFTFLVSKFLTEKMTNSEHLYSVPPKQLNYTLSIKRHIHQNQQFFSCTNYNLLIT